MGDELRDEAGDDVGNDVGDDVGDDVGIFAMTTSQILVLPTLALLGRGWGVLPYYIFILHFYTCPLQSFI